MGPFITQVVVQTILRHKNKLKAAPEAVGKYSNYQLAKGFYELKINLARALKDIILVGVGIFSASFGLKGFLLPNELVDGGATGISLLITGVFSIPLWLVLVLVNAPFILLGTKVIDFSFALKTALAIGGLAAATALLSFPLITQDKMLIAVFGGFFLGAGIGMAVRGGAVIDGTEVLALFLSRRFGITMGDVILIFNILIFLVAAMLLSVETAMYSIVTYLVAAKTVDFFIEGVEEYTGVTIISHKTLEIKAAIVERLGRGVTLYAGKKGIGKSGAWGNQDILFTVITRLEIGRLQAEVEKIDPHAFVVMHSIKDIKGGMIKKRPLKH